MTAGVVKRAPFGRATRLAAGVTAEYWGACLPFTFSRPTATGDSVETQWEDEVAPGRLRELVPVRALQPAGYGAELRHTPPQSLSLVPLEPAPGRRAWRPRLRMPRRHGTDRGLGAPRRRMGPYPPLSY